MEWMLQQGQKLVARGMQSALTVEGILGEGTQAEVFRVRIGNSYHALKWYRQEYLAVDLRLWDRLNVAIQNGSPTEQFLWPFDLVGAHRYGGCGGYLMPIKPDGFISLVDLIRGQTKPTFKALCTAGFRLAHSFLKLHAAGLCYRDINFGNVFFHPDTGDIRIADTDNVDINHKPGIIKGTPGFMAPEVGRDEIQPNASSDRFSLAVLLFYMFMLSHPLKGKREVDLSFDSTDPDGSNRLCVTNPVFVFHPIDDSNRPHPKFHGNLLSFWEIYPASFQKLFTRAFTVGLFDPDARIMENEWRKEMCVLRDSIFECPHCTAELFFDIEHVKQKIDPDPCWGCGAQLPYPPRLRIGDANDASIVVLNKNAELFAHHMERDTYNFSTPLARVVSNPLGLINLSKQKWTSYAASGTVSETDVNQTLSLPANCHINFGRISGEVKL